jgi:hypothetical protein
MKSEYKKPLLRCRLGHILLGDSPSALSGKCTLGRKTYHNRCEQCECNIPLMITDGFKEGLQKGIGKEIIRKGEIGINDIDRSVDE